MLSRNSEGPPNRCGSTKLVEDLDEGDHDALYKTCCSPSTQIVQQLMSSSDLEQAGARLRAAREKAGFASATEAARHFGWNENTYRSHENGERGIKPKVAEIYAQAFNISVDAIFFKEKSLGPFRIDVKGFIDNEGFIKNVEKSDHVVEYSFWIDLGNAFVGYLMINDGMYPRYSKGDIILFSRQERQDIFSRNEFSSEGLSIDKDGAARFGRLFKSPAGLFMDAIGVSPFEFIAVRHHPMMMVIRRNGYRVDHYQTVSS